MSYPAIARRKALFPPLQGVGFLRDYLVDCAILLAAWLIATHLRRALPFGKFVGENYEWYSQDVYLTVALALVAAHALRLLPGRLGPGAAARRFWAPVAGIALTTLGLTAFLPRQSGLQKGYFVAGALFLLLLIVPWPRSGPGAEAGPTFRVSLERLWANRGLLRIWVQYNVQSRYAQAVLGILWIVLLPLSTALVMSVVFSEIMRTWTGSVPFIAFFLAGLVPWGLFNQAISSGMRSILGAMGLINQIYFPREIIVLSALGEALVDAGFMFLAMGLINAAVGIWPTPIYAALPLLLLIQLAFSLGLMFIVSWLSVLVRDIPQLVSVALQILFYLCPIIYPASALPARYQFLITLNPVATLIEAYRGIIVYGRAPDWLSLLYPATLGIAFLIFGYRIFKANEDTFADLV